jgi:hypothetical protein
MGQVITRKAGTDRIIAAFNKTVAQAAARGGDVQSMAAARVGELQQLVADVDKQYNEARDVEEQLHVTLMARDANAQALAGTDPQRHSRCAIHARRVNCRHHGRLMAPVADSTGCQSAAISALNQVPAVLSAVREVARVFEKPAAEREAKQSAIC